MSRNPLWRPSEEQKRSANITRFIDMVNSRFRKDFCSYGELYNWSVENITGFWFSVWSFFGRRASRTFDFVVDDPNRMPGARWFVGARLNYAENLLRRRDEHTAFIFRGEDERIVRISYAELYDSVACLAKSLRDMGIKPGDRVVAYMPDMIETSIGMLAASSIGAIWASCATDIDPAAALNRFRQIEPKAMFVADEYFYKGKRFNLLDNTAEVARGIPSLEKVIVASYRGGRTDISTIPDSVRYEDFISYSKKWGIEIQFAQLPFDHPLYITFSSETTGKPRCIVHGAGGVLLNHMKENIIQTDLKHNDVLFCITSCNSMMWNWVMSSLATGNTIVLYDGNPVYPNLGAMWQLIQDEKVTVFGCSASYINLLRSEGFSPDKEYDLSSLREIWQTGSALSAEGFEYAYREIKPDVWLHCGLGGAELNGCFCGGNCISPVYAGELQGRSLGMKVKAYDENGNSVVDQAGKLVCEAAIPSMPICFWNDPNGEKYKDAYFSVYPSVWCQGDYIIIHSDTGGVTFFDHSDPVLKRGGDWKRF